MDAEDVLQALGSDSVTRVKVALRAVPQHAEELRNRVGNRLTACAERSLADPDDDTVWEAFWWMYVAAAIRAPGCHAAIATLLSTDDETSGRRWGDLITEDAEVLLADTFEGDRGPLLRMVANESISPWARETALNAITRLVAAGAWERSALVSLLEEQIEELLILERRSLGESWDETRVRNLTLYGTCLVGFIAFRLGAPELAPAVRRLIESGLYDESFAKVAQIEAALEGRNPYPPRPRPSIPLDVWRYVRDWYCFAPEEHTRVSRAKLKAKIGRNDPCPCGSGKKFKKCCGR